MSLSFVSHNINFNVADSYAFVIQGKNSQLLDTELKNAEKQGFNFGDNCILLTLNIINTLFNLMNFLPACYHIHLCKNVYILIITKI